MYYDLANTLVSSASGRKPVLLSHRLSGSYLTQVSDLQLNHAPLTGDQEKDKTSLWLLHADLVSDDGIVLYRIENVGTHKYMAIAFDPNNPHASPEGQPITFVDKLEPGDASNEQVNSQYWVFQPVEGASVLISPARFTALSLAPWDNNPATTAGCDRVPSHVTTNGNDNNCWIHHHRPLQYPSPQLDPFCHANCTTC